MKTAYNGPERPAGGQDNRIDLLIEDIRLTGAPVVVGLDPMLSYVPDPVLQKAYRDYGETLLGAAEAIWEFNREIINSIHDLVPAVKPQAAMYEQFGCEGMEVFKRTVDYAHEMGLTVIGDVKRGDIGSTSAAYAIGHLGTVQIGDQTIAPFDEDFVTVNPYLGTDGIEPFLEVCRQTGKGIFVLVKTSNPSSGEFQDRLVDGRPLYELVAEKVAEWGAACMGTHYSCVGAVVGGTYPGQGAAIRRLLPRAFLLVPGYGAQGARGKDLVDYFDEDGLGAVVNSSRGIIAAWQQEKYAQFGPENFADASRQAVLDMIADIRGALDGRQPDAG